MRDKTQNKNVRNKKLLNINKKNAKLEERLLENEK